MRSPVTFMTTPAARFANDSAGLTPLRAMSHFGWLLGQFWLFGRTARSLRDVGRTLDQVCGIDRFVAGFLQRGDCRVAGIEEDQPLRLFGIGVCS